MTASMDDGMCPADQKEEVSAQLGGGTSQVHPDSGSQPRCILIEEPNSYAKSKYINRAPAFVQAVSHVIFTDFETITDALFEIIVALFHWGGRRAVGRAKHSI